MGHHLLLNVGLKIIVISVFSENTKVNGLAIGYTAAQGPRVECFQYAPQMNLAFVKFRYMLYDHMSQSIKKPTNKNYT